jgi:hypothetical protein
MVLHQGGVIVLTSLAQALSHPQEKISIYVKQYMLSRTPFYSAQILRKSIQLIAIIVPAYTA